MPSTSFSLIRKTHAAEEARKASKNAEVSSSELFGKLEYTKCKVDQLQFEKGNTCKLISYVHNEIMHRKQSTNMF